jgi:hypothetical protein
MTLRILLRFLVPLLASGALAGVVLDPAAPGLDPQGVLAFARLPLGGCAVVRVSGGDGPLAVAGSGSALSLDATVGGGPAAEITTDKIVQHLLGAHELSGDDLIAADLDHSGEIDAADLVHVVLHGGTIITGGDPQALICARPDGDGPLSERNLTQALGTKSVKDDGVTVGTIEVAVQDNLMSVVPDHLSLLPGQSLNVALQIDTTVNGVATVAYRARIVYDPSRLTLTFLSGATDNEDFAAVPDFVLAPDSIELSDAVASRRDISQAAINVANVTFDVNSTAHAGDVLPFSLDQSRARMTPLGGSPLTPPAIKVLGCAVRIGP